MRRVEIKNHKRNKFFKVEIGLNGVSVGKWTSTKKRLQFEDKDDAMIWLVPTLEYIYFDIFDMIDDYFEFESCRTIKNYINETKKTKTWKTFYHLISEPLALVTQEDGKEVDCQPLDIESMKYSTIDEIINDNPHICGGVWFMVFDDILRGLNAEDYFYVSMKWKHERKETNSYEIIENIASKQNIDIRHMSTEQTEGTRTAIRFKSEEDMMIWKMAFEYNTTSFEVIPEWKKNWYFGTIVQASHIG